MHYKDLYEQYCEYASTLREKLSRELAKPQDEILTENQFLRAWQSLPMIEKRRWLTRFDAGSRQVILRESGQYASILGKYDSASLKAA